MISVAPFPRNHSPVAWAASSTERFSSHSQTMATRQPCSFNRATLRASLLALLDRIVDLLPVARDHYYHPDQEGSWSIKAVLPAICPDLDYADLEGVQNGGMAMEAYSEAIDASTTLERKAEIERQLHAYCALDTLALVRLWSTFSGPKLRVT